MTTVTFRCECGGQHAEAWEKASVVAACCNRCACGHDWTNLPVDPTLTSADCGGQPES